MPSEIKIGCLTIGQSPRPDILKELADLLPDNCRLTEKGALDGLSASELQAAAASGEEAFYVTLLRDGTEVSISELVLEQLLQNKLKEFERSNADLAILLCTGEFPPMESRIPFFRGGEIIKRTVKSMYRGKKIAIVVPDPDQNTDLSLRWKAIGIKHDIYNCLPYYETEQSLKLCSFLRRSNADFIVLDCIGFTMKMAEYFRKKTGKQVLLPRQMICDYLQNYLSCNKKAQI